MNEYAFDDRAYNKTQFEAVLCGQLKVFTSQEFAAYIVLLHQCHSILGLLYILPAILYWVIITTNLCFL